MSDSELAPPPYSEQEFDQKTSQALISSAQHTQTTEEQGEWEEWSEAAFAAAEAQAKAQNIDHSSHGAGSSTQSRENQGYPVASLHARTAIGPLRIHKRGKSSSASTLSKPRPSWMDEAETDGSVGKPGSSSSSHRPVEPLPPPDLRPWEAAQTHHEIPPDDEDEDRSIPPPPFATMGPPMDGISRLEYHPESTPPSPLTSPLPNHHLPLHPDYSSLQPDRTQQSHPTPQVHVESYTGHPINAYLNEYPRVYRPPRQSLPASVPPADYQLEQRPMSTLSPRQNHGTPRMDFNTSATPPRSPDHLRPQTVSTFSPPPVQSSSRVEFTSSLAYNKPSSQSFAPYQPAESFNPSAFYNSAVSAQLSIPMSMQPKESHSSRQQRQLATTYPHATTQRSALHSGNHTSSYVSSMNTVPSSAMNWSTSMVQIPYPAQHSANTSDFPQYPSYPTAYNGPTPHRWATTEQQYNRNFQ